MSNFSVCRICDPKYVSKILCIQKGLLKPEVLKFFATTRLPGAARKSIHSIIKNPQFLPNQVDI